MLHWNSYILSNGYIVSDLRARLSPDNVNKLVFLARNANLYFEVMCVCGGGGGGSCVLLQSLQVCYIHTYVYISTAHRMSSANIQGCVKCG